ncbi:MAG: isomerase [Proteobacteria bacterium]|nr:MAG: isomerase [Pseudomonadota bacterium]
MNGVFTHEKAIVESTKVGEGTRIWAFAHVLPGAVIGRDVNICDHVFIENDVQIGDRVTIKCGVQLWDGVRVENDVFIGPNVTFTNDPFPRSKCHPETFSPTVVREGASIGANATILPGITVGTKAMIGAGAVVTRDVPPHAIVVGNPARIKGYVTSVSPPILKTEAAPQKLEVHDVVQVDGVRVLELPEIEDLRGKLSFGEIETHLPFTPKRIFVVYDVPTKEVRGEHAHHELEQLLICIKGSLSVVVDDGHKRAEIELNTPRRALYIPPKVWGIQYKYSNDAVLLVLASEKYSAPDYIRSYDEYVALMSHRNE